MRMVLTALCISVLLTGCGGDSEDLTTEQAGKAVVRLMQDAIDEQNPTTNYYVGNPRCVADGDQRWQCLVEVDPEGEDPVDVSGSLRCDGENCIWKPDG